MSRRERVFWAFVEPVVAVGLGLAIVVLAGAGAVKSVRSWAAAHEVASA